jgi:hypothetical protein
VVTTPTPAVQPPSAKTITNKWWGKIRLYVAVIGVGFQVYAVYALKMSLDLLTGVALITLLFMMLQTEHERCDRVRAGWREVRRTTFTTTSAVQWAKKKQGLAGAQEYEDAARASLQELYGTILLYGQGSLREEYRKALNAQMQQKATLVAMLPVFGELDYKAEQKFATWKLVWL